MWDLKGKRVTVAGLGRFGGGIAVSQWLVEQGANVLVTDQAPAEKLEESRKKLEGLPIEFRLGEHRDEDFSGTDLVVTSPALAPSNKYLQIARQARVPVTTEICLFVERCPSPIIGVTGTKGKSTTTTLLGLMLKSKYTTWVGGNIGRSLLLDLPRIKKDDLVVLELSSFMLEYLKEMRWSPHVAVMTMLAADHVEWHGTVEAYVQAKANLLRWQGADDIAVLNEENETSRELIQQAKGKVIVYGTTGRKPFELKIPGQHNQLNAQAALAAANVYGISWQEAQDAIRDFPGLPHRLELVHERHGVRFYNDSIATIPEAAIAAMDAFGPRTVIQIVGGHDKKLPLTALCNALVERAKAVLCIGETGPRIAEMIANSAQTGAAPVYDCGDLATAMTIAKRIAVAGDVVLLSTGSSSYDQFTNFEERGQRFAQLARDAG